MIRFSGCQKRQTKHFDEEHRLAIAAAKRVAALIRAMISPVVLVIVGLALLGFAWALPDTVSPSRSAFRSTLRRAQLYVLDLVTESERGPLRFY